MNLYIATPNNVLRNDFGFRFEESPILSAIYSCDVPVSIMIGNKQFLFMKMNSVAGPIIVGFDKDEIPVEIIKDYVERIVISKKTYPDEILKISQFVEDWKGERIVGILQVNDLTERMNQRMQLSKFATHVVNLGSKDLYVFPNSDLLIDSDSRLSLSMPLNDKLEAIRQACVVDRYASFHGLMSYNRLLYHDVLVEIDEHDIPFIEGKLLHHDLSQLAKKFGVSLQEVYRRQQEIEQRYWLFFDNTVDQFLYLRGISSRSRR